MDILQIDQLVNSAPVWTKAQDRTLKGPFNYLLSNPGHDFRTGLIETFNGFYELSQQKVSTIVRLVEILHTSSLLIDDIEDSSEWRRGRKAAHLEYGMPMTINTANYMYFYAMECVQELSENSVPSLLSEVLIIFNEEMMNLHRGQGLDIYWRDNFIVPSEEEYLNMVMNKTGGLFRLTVRLMEVFSTKFSGENSLVPLSNLLGILYQIRDDYMNLQDATMILNKGFAEDVSEGKLSFPIIHGIRHGQSVGDTLVADILRARTQDVNLKKKLVTYLEETSGSIDYSYQKITQLSDHIRVRYFPSLEDRGYETAALSKIIERLGAVKGK
ncbi:LADA_0D04742g1_1 [Lachancea dasiensis]|uniref:LADA_0D04742g1_1 n=1 Tax=Lachancea dasiensis TaxID=1072105 RepID=A0A1G4J5W6_9SACH|nr:LADA_0D04742g1_1 [Lachancea dasiensis]